LNVAGAALRFVPSVAAYICGGAWAAYAGDKKHGLLHTSAAAWTAISLTGLVTAWILQVRSAVTAGAVEEYAAMALATAVGVWFGTKLSGSPTSARLRVGVPLALIALGVVFVVAFDLPHLAASRRAVRALDIPVYPAGRVLKADYAAGARTLLIGLDSQPGEEQVDAFYANALRPQGWTRVAPGECLVDRTSPVVAAICWTHGEKDLSLAVQVLTPGPAWGGKPAIAVVVLPTQSIPPAR
jgi:hypothetical protein